MIKKKTNKKILPLENRKSMLVRAALRNAKRSLSALEELNDIIEVRWDKDNKGPGFEYYADMVASAIGSLQDAVSDLDDIK